MRHNFVTGASMFCFGTPILPLSKPLVKNQHFPLKYELLNYENYQELNQMNYIEVKTKLALACKAKTNWTFATVTEFLTRVIWKRKFFYSNMCEFQIISMIATTSLTQILHTTRSPTKPPISKNMKIFCVNLNLLDWISSLQRFHERNNFQLNSTFSDFSDFIAMNGKAEHKHIIYGYRHQLDHRAFIISLLTITKRWLVRKCRIHEYLP